MSNLMLFLFLFLSSYNNLFSHNMKYETNIDMDAYISESGQSVFGVDIIHLMGENGELGIPKVIQDCATLLLANGILFLKHGINTC
jgi:hypothetical protein